MELNVGQFVNIKYRDIPETPETKSKGIGTVTEEYFTSIYTTIIKVQNIVSYYKGCIFQVTQ